jgi:hypothetical protein
VSGREGQEKKRRERYLSSITYRSWLKIVYIVKEEHQCKAENHWRVEIDSL